MPKRILVVDDNPETVDIVRQVLQKAGYTVLVAFDGEAGLAKADTTPRPDLILLDLMMPVMDGYTMHRHLQENAETRQIPVIILTALTGMMTAFDKEKTGPIAGYLVKPVLPAELLHKIVDVLEKRS
jgi:CheY-like chemotaxis protein